MVENPIQEESQGLLTRELSFTGQALVHEDGEDANHRYRILDIIDELPRGSTLYLDMRQVKFVSEAYAVLVFCPLINVTATTGSPWGGRRLIFVEPRFRIIQSLTKMVDDQRKARLFLYLDEDQTLHVGGKAFTPPLEEALFGVLTSQTPITKSDLATITGRESAQCSKDLKDLYRHGLVDCSSVPSNGKAGRPVLQYSAYWPERVRDWAIC